MKGPYIKTNKNTGETRLFHAPTEEYDNVTDRTTAEMMGEHLEAAYRLLKQSRPECKGYLGMIKERPNGDIDVTIDLIAGYKGEGDD